MRQLSLKQEVITLTHKRGSDLSGPRASESPGGHSNSQKTEIRIKFIRAPSQMESNKFNLRPLSKHISGFILASAISLTWRAFD